MLEVNLLKALNHPNIVSYKTSFITQGMLIIIMEYCEVGDLSFHIKRKLQKNESFTETEIFNWFVQLCLSLEYIHGRKVLHRDLKTQNIFLTGNNTVKLGDFGISKVLENTSGAAMTVVGTPYYMSPEICQNQPYTYKSDVWALGCVLYELCTLKHAFSADNLLGLVYKIVQDKYDPIPDRYSKDLQNLIHALLNKNASERPSVAQILQMPIVRQKMIEFVRTGGQTIGESKPVYVRNAPILIPAVSVELQQNASSSDDSHLTPAQRAKKRKEDEIRRREEELKAHARNAKDNYSYAKQMQYNQLYSSAKGTQQFDQTVIHNKPQEQTSYQPLEQTAFQPMQQTVFQQPMQQQNMPQNSISNNQAFLNQSHVSTVSDHLDGTGFSANDRDFDLSQSLGTQMGGLTIHQQHDSPSKFNNPSTYHNYEERKITGSGQYDMTLARSEFDIEEDFEEVIEAKEDKGELNEVIGNYQKVLNGIIEQCDDQSSSSSISPKKVEIIMRQEETKQQLIGNNKQHIMGGLGPQLFKRAYEYIKFSRLKSADEQVMQQELKRLVGGDKRLYDLCFQLDGIVFLELMKEGLI